MLCHVIHLTDAVHCLSINQPDVVQGSATLSMAYAGALFADSCLRGLNGDSNVFDYSYVESDVTDVPFFSSRVDLGPDGKQSLAHPICVHDCSVVQKTVQFEPCFCSRIGLQPNVLHWEA